MDSFEDPLIQDSDLPEEQQLLEVVQSEYDEWLAVFEELTNEDYQ